MNAFRLFLLVAGLFFSLSAEAQWRLLYQSQDILVEASDTMPSIDFIESRGTLSKYAIVHFSNRPKALVLKKSFWGFIDGRNRTWRSYQREFYLITSFNGGWVEYVINRIGINTRSGSQYNTLQRTYSRTLDSRISSVWSDAMSDVPPNYILR